MSVAGKGLQMEGLASTVVSLQRGRYLHHAPILTAHQHTNTSLCVAYLPLPLRLHVRQYVIPRQEGPSEGR